MAQATKNPGPLGGTRTRAKEKSANAQYNRYRSPHQARHLGRDSTARRPTPRGAKSPRARSDYLPGHAFMPDEETLSRRQGQVLELLKEHGPEGVTRLEAPDHLMLSWPQRISELRRMGYRIDSKLVCVGDIRVARYVLVSTRSGPRGTEAS